MDISISNYEKIFLNIFLILMRMIITLKAFKSQEMTNVNVFTTSIVHLRRTSENTSCILLYLYKIIYIFPFVF